MHKLFLIAQRNQKDIMLRRQVVNRGWSIMKLGVVFHPSFFAPCSLLLRERWKRYNLTPEVLELLQRFRNHRTGVTVDIQRDFRQLDILIEEQVVFRVSGFWFVIV